ncbi:MAG: family 43 glycosylhydrolase [Bifidobacterium sp.]|jgi:beta-xylosidase
MPAATNFPVIPMDYPDPDVIRVGRTYYMITTTMHFNPGGEILRSYDLVHWEHAAFVFATMDDAPNEAQRLENTRHVYGSGMWAGSLRYHRGRFYVLFIANDTHRSYLFTSSDIDGPWRRQKMQGFYYDSSLFFDDDDRVYVVHGNTDIHLTELLADCSGPAPSGLDRVVVRDDPARVRLGYEGSHFYKINGLYYLFVIHWPHGENGRRTESCFISESLDGAFTGGDVCDDDMGYRRAGVAQGGIVDDLHGNWYAMLFQDRGAAGRMPVLVPVKYGPDRLPVFGDHGRVPRVFRTWDNNPGHRYRPLVGNDDFDWPRDDSGAPQPKAQWEWNHVPDSRNWRIGTTHDEGKPCLLFTSAGAAPNVVYARNTLTTRIVYPYCESTITVDGHGLADGGHAGIVSLLSAYATAEITREDGKLYVRMVVRDACDTTLDAMPEDRGPGRELVRHALAPNCTRVQFKVIYDSRNGTDTSRYLFRTDRERKWTELGEHDLFWKMDFFTGCRIGLFCYSTTDSSSECRMSDFTISTVPGSS